MNLRQLKGRMSSKYPNQAITAIIKDAPDNVSPEELVGMVATWQSVIDAQKKETG